MIGRVAFAAALALAVPAGAAEKGRWKPMFNGRNLDGWVVKINHHPAGENWRDTVRVKDGVLKIAYDQYPVFKDEFTHLIYDRPLSTFRMRLEYRFVDQPTPGAAAWAVRNSGIMIHGQAPGEMALDQPYPVSVEAQILGGAPGQTRPTGNVCTPGVTVSIDGVPFKGHCKDSTSPTFQDGEWVKFEVEVHGSRLVRQYVNGQLVMEYGDIHLDPTEYKRFANLDPDDPHAAALIARGTAPLDRGYVSLQGESNPIEFRNIELMELPE
ncbi:MAG: DUF1080 domain-containing protein [Phenylobacterium sp.]|uniref:3-keto-disaccharide hydrolase n=1 Tax=Phenylobacterium sp. TaxID=1871053 RepID=UPI0025FD9D06|nr:DUF1080 domain-containing protein [Phenylobacterium sp.]MBI1197014.1 DUF1080 domain-containing protein [Phenylobacterium sp.]